MTDPKDLPYAIEGRQLIAEAPGLRVQILTLGNGEAVPWHYHTEITDTFACLEGPMVVKMPSGDHVLEAGDTCAVPPNTPHRVCGKDGGRCRFLVVQGVGAHDFIPVHG
ncbi:MAG: cupin domain-containing protein [Proteobacteria bacterium]|nr:cupin domain-containing protein [Pseudomonadota bacterium]